jgi:enoyl-CoA hydratase
VTYELITVEVDDAVATVTLSRPEALNAITAAMLTELGAAFDDLAARPSVAVVVLTGAGRAFSAGVDLKSLDGRPLDGGAVGDVLDLALACDLVITADEARLGDTHAQWGLRPSWGLSQRLPHAIGPQRARLLSYTARPFTGRQAEEWGLAALSCPAEELDAVVGEIAAVIASHSRGSLAAYKDLYRASDRLPMPEGPAYEAATAYPIDDTEDRIAAFR